MVKIQLETMSKFSRLLKKLYHDYTTPAGLTSQEKLYRAAIKKNPCITKRDIQLFLSGDATYTLHKPARIRYTTNKTKAKAVDHVWQADLTDLSNIAVYNDNIKFLLFVIDVYSRYLFITPLKNKKGTTVAEAFNSIFKSNNRIPGVLITDKGSEFISKEVQLLLKKYNIGYATTNSIHKASIAERVQRTIKMKMSKYFTLHNTHQYINILDDLVNAYNHSVHSTVCSSPYAISYDSVSPCNIKEDVIVNNKQMFNVGDHVRVSKAKTVFEKGYNQNWTIEIFTVSKIIHPRVSKNKVYMYKIKDLAGEEIIGRFYSEELQKVKYDPKKRFLIEKVISVVKDRNSRKKALVKWLGYSERFNSWIPYAELKKLKANI